MSTRFIGGDREKTKFAIEQRRERMRVETEARVDARIYKDFNSLPQKSLVELDPLMVNLMGDEAINQAPLWDRVVDYDAYTKRGFDPDILQSMYFKKFTGKLDDGRLRYSAFYHFLHPDGNVYRQEESIAPGRGVSRPSDVVIGRWELVVPKETAEYSFASRRFIALYDEDEIEVDFNSTFVDETHGQRYCFAHTIDAGSISPMERVPIRYEENVETSVGKVIKIGEGYYTYRDFLGILKVTKEDGSTAQHLLCNSKASTIDRHRTQFANALARWSKLSSEMRREIFNVRGKHAMSFLQPRPLFESWTANVDTIIGANKIDSFFVPLRKKDDDTYEQIK